MYINSYIDIIYYEALSYVTFFVLNNTELYNMWLSQGNQESDLGPLA